MMKISCREEAFEILVFWGESCVVYSENFDVLIAGVFKVWNWGIQEKLYCVKIIEFSYNFGKTS